MLKTAVLLNWITLCQSDLCDILWCTVHKVFTIVLISKSLTLAFTNARQLDRVVTSTPAMPLLQQMQFQCGCVAEYGAHKIYTTHNAMQSPCKPFWRPTTRVQCPSTNIVSFIHASHQNKYSLNQLITSANSWLPLSPSCEKGPNYRRYITTRLPPAVFRRHMRGLIVVVFWLNLVKTTMLPHLLRLLWCFSVCRYGIPVLASISRRHNYSRRSWLLLSRMKWVP